MVLAPMIKLTRKRGMRFDPGIGRGAGRGWIIPSVSFLLYSDWNTHQAAANDSIMKKPKVGIIWPMVGNTGGFIIGTILT